MENLSQDLARRYQRVTEVKASGATYTPKLLADFVASQIIEAARSEDLPDPVTVLDPAVGDGELLLSLLRHLGDRNVVVYGFETDAAALGAAARRIERGFPSATIRLQQGDFLSFVSAQAQTRLEGGLFDLDECARFDLVIANPPYVRTQVMGALQAQQLAREFGLTGRVDLYFPFLVAIGAVLKPKGIAGVITSNRFMTTRAGAGVRRALLEHAVLRKIWDLGDSKIFDAAVLPAVLLLQGKNGPRQEEPSFISIYQTTGVGQAKAPNPIEALAFDGIVTVDDGRRFNVRHGSLSSKGLLDRVWTISTNETDGWLEKVASKTWRTFGDIGKVRVGIKTTADKIFIRRDWGIQGRPELLRPLTTHHVARRFRALDVVPQFEVLYPHVSEQGVRRVVDLADHPNARRYLEQHRTALESRNYVIEAGRQWHEVWVPQDPGAWQLPKLVFRDISAQPIFWLDFSGSVVNGDCYWLASRDSNAEALLWLAASVANSTFIESFYDHKFNNKLYSGRRRFITQYVEQFPLPDPRSQEAQEIVRIARTIYEETGKSNTLLLERTLNDLVWAAFGLSVEKVPR